jgi:acyl-CoA thioester hydrolase
MDTFKNILESKLRIQYHDCDPYNHLNNSRYIDYLISARTEQLIENYGFDTAKLAQSEGIGWVVAQNQISYLYPATWSEIVTIETRLISFSDASLVVEALMWDEFKTHLKAIMWTVLVHFDIKTQKSIKHSEYYKSFFAGIRSSIEESTFEARVKALKTIKR